MNIFILDIDPFKAASMQCDKHVVKMILESAQMLCTAHRELDGTEELLGVRLYKSTHKNHPCSVWVRESKTNYMWLHSHFIALCDEYTKRYSKVHLTDTKFRRSLSIAPKNIPVINGLSPFRMAMPDEYKSDNIVESYRNYYQSKTKAFNMKWTKSSIPEWLTV